VLDTTASLSAREAAEVAAEARIHHISGLFQDEDYLSRLKKKPSEST